MSYRVPLPAGELSGTPYQIEQLLAEGGFALVYLAAGPKGKVVIKELFDEKRCRRLPGTQLEVLPGQGPLHERQKQRCREEWARFKGFRHPYIVQLEDYFEANNTCYTVMPYVDGESLLDRVLRKPLNLIELLALVKPLGDALDALHEISVVHRDVKPDNIWLRNVNGQPLLLDTGAARSLEWSRRGGTRLLTMLGAPELRGQAETSRYGQVGPATDVFALAGVCAFALTGREPPDATLRDLAKPGSQDPLELWPMPIPDAVSRVIRAGMALRVADRLQSPGAFARALALAHTHGVGPGQQQKLTNSMIPSLLAVSSRAGGRKMADWLLAMGGNLAFVALSSMLTPEDPVLGVAIFLVAHMASVLYCAHQRMRKGQPMRAMDALPVANLLLLRGDQS